MDLAVKTICEYPVLSVPLDERFSPERRQNEKEITNTLLLAPRSSLPLCRSSPVLRRILLLPHRSTPAAELCWLFRLLNGRKFSVESLTGPQSRTIFAFGGDLQNLRCHHLKFLLYQAIKPL